MFVQKSLELERQFGQALQDLLLAHDVIRVSLSDMEAALDKVTKAVKQAAEAKVAPRRHIPVRDKNGRVYGVDILLKRSGEPP